MTLLSADGISIQSPLGCYRINSMSLEVSHNQILVVVGPTGSGKSTLLRLLMGLETPGAGDLVLDGEIQNTRRPSDRPMSLVLEDDGLYPHLTIRENLELSRRAAKHLRRDQSFGVTELEALADVFEMSDCLAATSSRLSAIERRSANLVRALIKGLPLVLYDEPTKGLDIADAQKLLSKIRTYHKKHQLAAIFATSDPAVALYLADRMLLIRDGQLQQLDAPGALYDQPQNKFVADYLSTNPLNFCDLVLSDGQAYICHKSEPIDVASLLPPQLEALTDGGGEAILALRSEDIMLHLSKPEAPRGTVMIGQISDVTRWRSGYLIEVEISAMRIRVLKKSEPPFAGEPVWIELAADKAMMFSKDQPHDRLI